MGQDTQVDVTLREAFAAKLRGLRRPVLRVLSRVSGEALDDLVFLTLCFSLLCKTEVVWKVK